MYATAGQILRMNGYDLSSNMVSERYVAHSEHEFPLMVPKKKKEDVIEYKNENYTQNTSSSPQVQKQWRKKKIVGKTSDPRVWGPPFWTSLHISAAHYPLDASPIVRERMIHRIHALPYEIPCQNCRAHASAFIEKNKDNLPEIVSGRHNLGKFYVDFHNQVNKRYGKPEWTYEQAYKVYSGNAEIEHLVYE